MRGGARPHRPRTDQDIEGFALLCPDCVGRAQDNEFLRFRLRQGLEARAQASRRPDPAEQYRDYYAAVADEYDDWYLGRGRHARPAIESATFAAELDAATLWLDRLPLSGEIVELAAGTGWWSPLLAQKGELWLYDLAEALLDRARQRLLAHNLAAHIHVRDAWQPADRQVDALFSGFWLPHVPRARLADFCAIARGWLKPGGTYAFIEDPAAWRDEDGPPAEAETVRVEAGGREFELPVASHSRAHMEAALAEAGFADVQLTTTGRHFLLGQARG